MGDGSLSPEEIDALLMGAEDMGGDPMAGGGTGGGGSDSSSNLSPTEQEVLNDNFQDVLNACAEPLKALAGDATAFSNVSIEMTSQEALAGEISDGSAVLNVSLGTGNAFLVIPADTAKKMAGQLMGGGEAADLDEAAMASLGEFTSTLFNTFARTANSKFSQDLTSNPGANEVATGGAGIPQAGEPNVLKTSFNVAMDGGINARVALYGGASNVRSWFKSSQPAAAGAADLGAMMGAGMDQAAAPQAGIPVNPVNFPSLQTGTSQQLPPNFELLLDVQMVLTVELGRTKKYVKDILSLGEGSIIELDKLAGEPVDLLVNGKLIAKGEVVVIDENFGVRVTDIVGPAERLARMAAD
jgi:flagellar motor switch protein FliN/FliY